MKRVILGMMVLFVVGACVCPALAANRGYFSQVVNVSSNQGNAWSRSYYPLFATVTPGSASCTSSGTQTGTFDSTTRACQIKWNSTNQQGYKAMSDNSFNDGGPSGDVRCDAMDLELNSAAANHVGYYTFAAKAVTDGGTDTSAPFTPGCTGTQAPACLGSADNTNATGTAVINTPLGTINPIGGWRPIPVPIVGSANKATGAISLSWQAASSLTTVETINYRLVGLAKSSCTPPVSSEFATGHVYADNPGLAFTANTNDFGNAPTVPACYYFALKLVYPPAAGTDVPSLFFSANSAGVVFGGLATTFSSIKVSPFKNGVDVSWSTSLEDGTRGFYVTRAAGAGQPFERVSPLIQANGQPSTYHYLDMTVGAAARNRALWRIEALDADNNAATSDAVPMTRK